MCVHINIYLSLTLTTDCVQPTCKQTPLEANSSDFQSNANFFS